MTHRLPNRDEIGPDEESLLHVPKIGLSVMFNTVRIEFECKGDYEAQVLFDDLAERLLAGQDIKISGSNWQKAPDPP